MEDIISSVRTTLTDQTYLSFACYALDLPSSIHTQLLSNNDPAQASEFIINLRQTLHPQSQGCPGWYNHSVYSPRHLHFTTAITKKNLDELKGFDERFAFGMDFDDDDFRMRVIRKGLTITPIDNPFSAHQWHNSSYVDTEVEGNTLNPQQLHNINSELFHSHTKHELGWEAVLHEHYNCNGH